MKAAGIIAAGWGERLGQKIPKALTPVGDKVLIDYTLEAFAACGVEEVTCIVNEAARAVPEHVARHHPKLRMDWIIRTTPSSMHSFLIVLERLSRRKEPAYVMTTVDSVYPPSTLQRFIDGAARFPEADVVLGLTDVIEDENPLRVAMHGEDGTGLLPPQIEGHEAAFEILAMTNNGFDSEFVTSGFYRASARILKEKEKALENKFSALRQYLGFLLKYGYRFYGVPLPPVVDVDRPQDIRMAEKMLSHTK